MATPNTTTKELEQQQPKAANPLVTLREQLNQRLPEYKNALPPHITPERFVRVVLTSVQLNPDLLAADRQSFWNACMRAASDGLLPDGRQGVIVAFKTKQTDGSFRHMAQWMIMVSGLLTRFRNSGQFKAVTANVVREGEAFKYWIDENGEHLMHEPGDGTGNAIKAYALAITRDGGVMIKVMSREEIEKRRAISRAKDGPMWREWWDEAAMKTVLRNLHKRLPSSSDDLDRLMRRDEENYSIVPTEAPHDRQERVSGVMERLAQFGNESPVADGEAKSTTPTGAATDAAAPPIAPQGTEGDPLAIAREAGRQARDAGLLRRAIPLPYRDADREAEARAWEDGWDNGGTLV